MKSIFGLLLVLFSITASAECVRINGIYQTSLSGTPIEEARFQKITQEDCSSISLNYSGYFNEVLGRPYFDIRTKPQRFWLNGVPSCDVFDENCQTATIVEDTIVIDHPEQLKSNADGDDLCYSNQYTLFLDAGGALIHKYNYSKCKLGSEDGVKTFVFTKYIN